MRRLLLVSAVLAALAVPAAAFATQTTDGTLVVKGADNGDGIGPNARPVATFVVTGFVIGRVTDLGRIQIFDIDPTDQGTPEVTGAGQGTTVQYKSFPGTEWSGTDFRFRAVNGTFRVVVWGSGVYVFASGHGKVTMTGNPAAPNADGSYSLNGGGFQSLTTQSILLNG
ncbi:MAG: hypothetical protein JOZ56_04960 [Actinobacteria bacterium]|nr:hypothetical protein [Actinomycetota bacterium]MBV8562420.1 hypothetical protein [Actinomycetota bacterium]